MTLRLILILAGIIALQGGLGFAYYKYQKAKTEALEARVEAAETTAKEVQEAHEDFKEDLRRNQAQFEALANENSRVRREMNDLKRRFRELDLDGEGRVDPAKTQQAVNDNFRSTFDQVKAETE